MAKFLSNANILAATKVSPFLVSYSYISLLNFNLVDFMVLSICELLANAETKSIANCMEEM